MSVSLVKTTGRHRDPAEERQPDLYYSVAGERTYVWYVGDVSIVVPIAHFSADARHAA